MKKRLTFSFLPWVAAAGVCLGGSFARSEDGSVLVGGEAAAAAAPAQAVVADRHTLADVLARLRSRPEEARRIAANARELVRAHLSRRALRRMLADTLTKK